MMSLAVVLALAATVAANPIPQSPDDEDTAEFLGAHKIQVYAADGREVIALYLDNRGPSTEDDDQDKVRNPRSPILSKVLHYKLHYQPKKQYYVQVKPHYSHHESHGQHNSHGNHGHYNHHGSHGHHNPHGSHGHYNGHY